MAGWRHPAGWQWPGQRADAVATLRRTGHVSDTPYNHYSVLASMEDLFVLPHLAYTDAPGPPRFGPDDCNRRA